MFIQKYIHLNISLLILLQATEYWLKPLATESPTQPVRGSEVFSPLTGCLLQQHIPFRLFSQSQPEYQNQELVRA